MKITLVRAKDGSFNLYLDHPTALRLSALICEARPLGDAGQGGPLRVHISADGEPVAIPVAGHTPVEER